MKLAGVELRLVDVGLRRAIGTAAGAHRTREVAAVRVVTDGPDGWGECAALPEGTVVDPPLGAVWDRLVTVGARRLLDAARARDGDLPPAAVVAGLFGSSPVDRMAAAAVEMAVLDAELRLEGRPLWDRLGAPADGVAAGVAVGELVGIPAGRDLDTLMVAVAAAAARSARVRLKIAPGWDVEPVGAVRAAWPALALQADANAAYRWGSGGPDDAMGLARLDAYGLTCVEQPLAPADLPGHARLADVLATPVCLDESLATERQVVDALRYGALEVACLKPGRLGGLLAARRVQRRCADEGVAAFVGGFFETGLARTANVALAALEGFTLPGDLSDPAGYLAADPWPYPAVATARVRPPDGPGVAPAPDARRLEGSTRSTVTVRAAAR